MTIDVSIRKVCALCKTDTPLRYLADNLVSLGERTRLEFRVDPDEFLLCSTCGNPTRIHIQCQPYELVHHLDTPGARSLYDQGQR